MPEPVRHGVVYWPGVEAPVSATYTCSHGVSPGTAVLTMLPQGDAPGEHGDLILDDGVVKITLPRCKVDRLDVVRDGSGTVWQLHILDRRWRWREFGVISGYYNQNDPHGLRLPWTLKPPHELARLCLDAMGEPEATVDMPDAPPIAWPPVDWDSTSPASALTGLVEPLGCRVVYDVGSDLARVLLAGDGESLPEGSISSEGPTLDPPERPDAIVCVGAPMRFQMRFRCEAVGRDWDGFWRPVDNLSYAPKNLDRRDPKKPWRYVFGPSFTKFPATDRLTPDQVFEYARSTIYKCYRLVNVDPGDWNKPLKIPGTDVEIVRREQIILEDCRVEQIQPSAPDERILDVDGQKLIKHYYNGFRRDKPAACFGSYFIGSTGNLHAVNKVVNTSHSKEISVGFSIDPTWQVLTFDDYVFTVRKDGGVAPAEVVLECACTIRDAVSNQVLRYERELDLGDPRSITKPLYIRHEDVVCNVVQDYAVTVFGQNDTAEHKATGIRLLSGQGFGIDDTILRSNHYLVGAARKYETAQGDSRTYNGLVEIWLDGAIQQVTWSVGEPGGAVTVASRNSEHSPWVAPYPARLRIEEAPPPARRENKLDGRPPVEERVLRGGVR